jgi:hypothetical protein
MPPMPRTMRADRLGCLAAALWLNACAVESFERPGASDEAAYSTAHPYYAEFCALSQIKKKPGFGADIRGEIGGHAVFYLNGACRVKGARYPLLRVCDGSAGAPPDGVGLSMNEHFSNAKWVATPGRGFFFHGNLPADAPVTRQTYAAVQDEAKRLGIYDGVVFHEKVFADMPPGWRREDWQYEVSVATDYAISLGRGRFCARVPVDRPAMGRMVEFLNAENAPYRSGAEVFRWSVFRDNCIHLAHNALAAAGLWDEWRTHRPLLLAMLDFPVPKNEFVNLMRRTNDALPLRPDGLDAAARRSLLRAGTLPTIPGALAEARPPQRPNAVYDTELKLIFYDEPNFGPYQGWFDAIWREPRYHDARANLEHFRALYGRIEAASATPPTDADAAFRRHVAQQRRAVDAALAALAPAAGARPAADGRTASN